MFRIIYLILIFAVSFGDFQQFRIIEGSLAGEKEGNQGQHPYIVRWRKGDRYWCGGTIIKPDVVLTAVHCLTDDDAKDPSTLTVTAGTFNIGSKPDPTKQERTVKFVARFPGHVQKTQEGDVTLLFLEKPFDIDDHVKPIKLSHDKMDGSTLHGKSAMIMGWGLTEEQVESEDLLFAKGKVEDFDSCMNTLATTFGDYITAYHPHDQKQICFKSDNNMKSGPGYGDSGGPLILLNDSENPDDHVQIGVSSLHDYLDHNNPAYYTKGDRILAFYTDVGLFRYWIDQTLGWWENIKSSA